MTRPGAVQAAPPTTGGTPVLVTPRRRFDRGPRRLGLWRLEWLRLVRTRRWILLALTFPGLAAIAPFIARYHEDILGALGIEDGDVNRTPGAVDGMFAYLYPSARFGFLVVLGMTASVLAIDHRPGLSAFHRTRLRRARDLVIPRVITIAAATSFAYVLGTGIAWGQVRWLFGSISARDTIFGAVYGLLALYLVFAVAAAVAAVLVRPMAIFGASIVALLVLAVPAAWRPFRGWIPTGLGAAPVEIARGDRAPGDYAGAAVVGVVLIVLLLWFSLWRIGRRET